MEEVTADEAKDLMLEENEIPREKAWCAVTNPEKVENGVIVYMVYTVKTKNADGTEASTVRRYSDFDWLRDQLKEEYRHILIPPLPEKGLINRFSAEFVEYRRKELERFMKRVLNHPILKDSKSIPLFLHSTDAELQGYRSKGVPQEEKPKAANKKGFFATFTASISSVTNTLTGVELTETDPWFDKHKTYLNNLEQQLQLLGDRSESAGRRRAEMSSAVMDLSHSASLLSGAETDQDGVLAEDWGRLSDVLNRMATLSQELVASEAGTFEDVVKDYYRLVGAAKDIMDNRASVLQKLQNYQADVVAKKEKIAKGDQSRKLQADLTEVEDKEAKTSADFKELSEKVQAELEKFKRRKNKDLVRALRELAMINMTQQLQVVNLWKELLNDLDDTKKTDI